MMGKKVSNEQREEILRRTREGGKNNLQKEIAADMKLSKGTIRAIELQAGLRRHPGFTVSPEQETRVYDLVRQGHGQPHICQALNLPPGPVRECMARFRGRQARGAQGYRYEFSKIELRAIKRDLREAQREARRAIAHKWNVTAMWVKEFENMQKEKHRQARAPLPFLPKSQDVLHLLRALLPTGIPFDARHDAAAAKGLLDGVKTFLPLPETYADGLRSQFVEALRVLRREANGEWVH
jgi:hypothetical protein